MQSAAVVSRPTWRRFIPGLVVAAVTALAFSRSVGLEFVAWDDEILLVANPGYRGLGWDHLRWMAENTLLGSYWRLTATRRS